MEDKQGKTLMKTTNFNQENLNKAQYRVKEITLGDGEHLVGVTSASSTNLKAYEGYHRGFGYHFDLQFVIGKFV